MNSKKVRRRWLGEGRNLQFSDIWQVASEAFQHSSSMWNSLADSAVFLWLNCLGDSGSQKLKKYMSIGKEKLSGRSTMLSGIPLAWQVSILTMWAERHSYAMLCAAPQTKEPLKHILCSMSDKEQRKHVNISVILNLNLDIWKMLLPEKVV